MRLASGGAKAGFTGMFAADSIGLVRVSLARHQVPSFTPGLAVKMLIDGQKVCFTRDQHLCSSARIHHAVACREDGLTTPARRAE